MPKSNNKLNQGGATYVAEPHVAVPPVATPPVATPPVATPHVAAPSATGLPMTQLRTGLALHTEAIGAKNLGAQEGILEAEQCKRDGKWYVQVDKEWVEVMGSHFCPLCWKHLNECTLQAHLDSNEHRKKIAWQRSSGMGAVDTLGSSAQNGSDEWNNWNPNDPWLEQDSQGYWRCVPCGKMADMLHLQSEAHKRKVEEFMLSLQPAYERYPDPPEEFLVWMPVDENDPEGQRWLRCLLCGRWVNDEWSHGVQDGSKEHVKNLNNHYHPRSNWYLDVVLPAKEQYSLSQRPAATSACHPPYAAQGVAATAAALPGSSAAGASWAAWDRGFGNSFGTSGAEPQSREQPPAPQTPPPWSAAWSEEHGTYYYWNRETQAVQWEHPGGLGR